MGAGVEVVLAWGIAALSRAHASLGQQGNDEPVWRRRCTFLTGSVTMATGGTTSPPSIPRHTNRLINEKSPYLLQHAHNPVDW